MKKDFGTRVLKFRRTYEGDRDIVEVLLAPMGESMQSTQTWHRVERLRPPEDQSDDEGDSIAAMRARWETIGPAYEAYLKGSEIPVDGTPLGAWSAVQPEQADFLKKQGYDTVEAIASMTETQAMKLPWPNSNRLPELAQSFLSQKDATKLEQEKKDLEDRIAVMEEMLNEQAGANKPKRRGRPPKQPVDQPSEGVAA